MKPSNSSSPKAEKPSPPEQELRITYWEKRVQLAEHALVQIKKHLDHCTTWERVQQEGWLLQAHVQQIRKGATAIQLPDWSQDQHLLEIALNPRLAPQAQIEQKHKLAKRLKRGLTSAKQALLRQEQLVANFKAQLQKAREGLELTTLPTPSLKEEQKILPYDEFGTASGLKIWVGKNASKNDQLTFQYAAGNDWWMHVSDYPGPHVILKVPKGKMPDEEALLDAMTLAIATSKAKNQGVAEVLVTQKKFVSRLGKIKGKVQVSQGKHHTLRFDAQRYQAIKDRNII